MSEPTVEAKTEKKVTQFRLPGEQPETEMEDPETEYYMNAVPYVAANTPAAPGSMFSDLELRMILTCRAFRATIVTDRIPQFRVHDAKFMQERVVRILKSGWRNSGVEGVREILRLAFPTCPDRAREALCSARPPEIVARVFSEELARVSPKYASLFLTLPSSTRTAAWRFSSSSSPCC